MEELQDILKTTNFTEQDSVRNIGESKEMNIKDSGHKTEKKVVHNFKKKKADFKIN